MQYVRTRLVWGLLDMRHQGQEVSSTSMTSDGSSFEGLGLVVWLDLDLGWWRLRGRGPWSQRRQRVRLGGGVEKRSCVQDLDGTFFALLYLPRLQLLCRLFKQNEKNGKYALYLNAKWQSGRKI